MVSYQSRQDELSRMNINTIEDYLESSKVAYQDILAETESFRSLKARLGFCSDDVEAPDNVASRMLEKTDRLLDEWEKFDKLVTLIVERLKNPPALPFDEIDFHWVPEIESYIGLDRDDPFETSWDDLTEAEQALLTEHAPEIVLHLPDVPEHVKERAREAWWEDVQSETPLFGITGKAGLDVRVFWVTISAELMAEVTIYADGSIRIKLEASGSLGVELGIKVSVGAGVEGAMLVVHEFGNLAEAARYLENLKTAVSGFDLGSALDLLTKEGSIVRGENSVGVYAEVEASTIKIKAKGRLSGGFKKDWVNNINIEYLNAQLSLHTGLGNLEAQVGIERRTKGDLLDEVVIEVRITGESDPLREWLSKLMGYDPKELLNPIPDELGFWAKLTLDLNDPEVKRAWEDFQNNDFDLGRLWNEASVHGGVYAEHELVDSESSVGGFGVKVEAEVEVSSQAWKNYFHKDQGLPPLWVLDMGIDLDDDDIEVQALGEILSL